MNNNKLTFDKCKYGNDQFDLIGVRPKGEKISEAKIRGGRKG